MSLISILALFTILANGCYGIRLPDNDCQQQVIPFCMEMAEKVWPSYCLNDKSHGPDTFTLAKNEFWMPLWKKLKKKRFKDLNPNPMNQDTLKIPDFKAKEIQGLLNSVEVEGDKKKNTSFCLETSLKDFANCAAKQFNNLALNNLAFTDKYLQKPNCEIVKRLRKDQKIWDWAKKAVVKIVNEVVKKPAKKG